MAHYLVTGAAGFIASRTAALLLEQGHRVVGIDNLNDAYDQRVKRYRLEQLQAREGFSFVEGDISNRSLLEAAPLRDEPFDAVFNLAARAGVRTSVQNPWVYLDTNATGTLNLLELCKERKIPKFVLASTSSVYGKESDIPYAEEQVTGRPISPYAASKKAAEVMSHAYHHLYEIDVTILRYFTVYGPAGRPDMSVFRFVQRIREGRPITVYGDGTMSRDFTYVDDIARGTIAAVRPLGYEIINLGGDHPYQVRELISTIEAQLDRKAQIQTEDAHPADLPVTSACIDKARLLLEWEPQVDLEEGIARCIAWYEAERDWAKDVVVY
jgi:nucleoside-diphosphate-sugar epimerase